MLLAIWLLSFQNQCEIQHYEIQESAGLNRAQVIKDIINISVADKISEEEERDTTLNPGWSHGGIAKQSFSSPEEAVKFFK